MRTGILAALFTLSGCVSAGPAERLQAEAPLFDPMAFFAGATEGEGRVDIMLSDGEQVHVRSLGRIEPDGTLVLDQEIERDGKTETRSWRIRQVGPARYGGTLTTADGPVTGEVEGNRLHLEYRLREGGLDVDQWLYLQPGGRVALNRMEMKKFGIPVAALEETIRKTE